MNSSTDQEKKTRDWFKCSACRKRKIKASGPEFSREVGSRAEADLLFQRSACLNLETGKGQSRSASIVRLTVCHADRITETMRIPQSTAWPVRTP